MRIFLLIFLALVLAACSQPPKEDAKYQPVVNPHPKYFFTVSGKIDRELAKNNQLTWTATYISTNSDCLYTDNTFAGTRTYRERSENYVVNMSQNNYQHKFYIDKYQPGFCRWKLSTVSYKLNLEQYAYLDTVYFVSQKKLDINMKADSNIVCKTYKAELNCQDKANKYFSTTRPAKLALNQNYEYQLNVLETK